jgi:type IV pilus assembly protein PilA
MHEPFSCITISVTLRQTSHHGERLTMHTVRALSSLSSVTRFARRGVTLVELMIVVVIMGVLAGVATVGYSSYIRRSRTQEARAMLAAIGSREDAYRAEFAQYCAAGNTSGTPPTSLGETNAWPLATMDSIADPFFTTSTPVEWQQLGFRPTGNVRFRYMVLTGPATVDPPGQTGFSAAPNADLWYVAEAYGNLDADSEIATYRLFSGNGNQITATNENE